MGRLPDWDTPPRIDEAELIDDDSQPYADFRASMIDVQRANRFLGGLSVVTRQMREWLRSAVADPEFASRPVTILDVATGSADIPRAIMRSARSEHTDARVVGLDFSAPILRFAREEIGAAPAVRLLRGSAFRLPFRDACFDFVLCSLAFHHFGFEGSIAALREMERVARRGWLVNDLRRARSAWVAFRTIAALARMNRLTRHDGPASILRSYSEAEFRDMPAALGLKEGKDFRIRRSPFYRMAIVRNKAPSDTVSSAT